MAKKKQPKHIRLPQRAEAVEGVEPELGGPPIPIKKTDPRTASQDPVLKSKRVMKTAK
jgi:hypothetical protein